MFQGTGSSSMTSLIQMSATGQSVVSSGNVSNTQTIMVNRPQQTTFCPYCSVQLSYPQFSIFIQCPKCHNTMNPQAPQQSPCRGCGSLLAHPASSHYVQCPKCMTVMNPRDTATYPPPTTIMPQYYVAYQSVNDLPASKWVEMLCKF